MSAWVKQPISEVGERREILTSIDREWIILRWEDRQDHAGRCDTVTRRPGWTDGTYDTSGSIAHHGLLLVFEPTHFYALPDEGEDDAPQPA
ncbi:hypothetical protein CcrC1_gp306 [Caulobacter phage C1]|nr:hypothetical protein CcrC1_gp306 [Caulobacter phage C1]UTU08535.1 hypothetical protein CcrC2_gp307 [Caulobacter phage C2]UTU09051.1 hypothetical protein CcrJ4_gp302 [Caulobacter phage J4]UTU10168.1 hypothetical protein CcrRB23_gp306 [Caulobacter phage RB23]WGN97202.1 hypothetical protein [Bertelyvirus sp.]